MAYYITRMLVALGVLFMLAGIVLGFYTIWQTDPMLLKQFKNTAVMAFFVGVGFAIVGGAAGENIEKPLKNKENAA